MKHSIGLSIAVILAVTLTTTGAEPMYQLDVTYTNGSIISGPLSFGLSTLPTSVSARFILGPGEVVTPEPEDPSPGGIFFDEADALFGRLSFGDATWTQNDTENNLESFSMFYSGSVIDLSYRFLPITTATVAEGIQLNFPLTITGTDIASNTPFEYVYTDSTQTLTEIPFSVAIDIKPGSYPNCFNINGHGVIPVAVLGSEDFDVSQIDLTSLSFGGLEVRVRGNKGPLCSIEYSNDDIYPDLVCHFEDDASNWQPRDGQATLTGTLIDGTPFEGTDSICIVGGTDVMYQLDVTYTNGSIISGPLSFGLSTLPTSVTATFILGPGEVVTPEPEDPSPGGIFFDEADALFGRLSFGDATWTQNDTENNLESFSMFYSGSVIDLSYRFLPITTATVAEGISLNFPLTITGTDIASSTPFEYEYTDSTQTLTELN